MVVGCSLKISLIYMIACTGICMHVLVTSYDFYNYCYYCLRIVCDGIVFGIHTAACVC